MQSDPAGSSIPPSPFTSSLPDPFSRLSRFDRFRDAVAPLAAEFWAARQPLKAALMALEGGDDGHADYATRWLVAGEQLRSAGLSAFPSERANAGEQDAAPTTEQIATQAAWCALAAGVAEDGARVVDLLEQLATRPAVRDELDDVLEMVTDTTLAKWRCVASPPFVERLRKILTDLNLTPTDAMAWLHDGGADLSPAVRNALRGWLCAVETGRMPELDDGTASWGPEVPGLPVRRWVQSNPLTEERRDRTLAHLARQVRTLRQTTQDLFTRREVPSAASPPRPASAPAQLTAPAAKPGEPSSLALLRIFTNRLADDRIEKATRVVDNGALTANEKLTRIDALVPVPPTASAEQLGQLLGVSKQAIMKTSWWVEHRRGEKDSEIGRRRDTHARRAKEFEPDDSGEDDG